MRHGLISLGCALALALAGCGAEEAAGTEAGGPPGGWPTPVNGRLTERMCELLTNADYEKFGHSRMPVVSLERAKSGRNSVRCAYAAGDELKLHLQPTPEGAKLSFAADLKKHMDRVKQVGKASVLITGVVEGADQSWFDYAAPGEVSQYPRHRLVARRGALIIDLTLSGIRGKREQEPRAVLTGLADLVLKRISDVGKTAAQPMVTNRVTYTVTGKGTADQLIYTRPADQASVTLRNVPLPWSIELPMQTQGDESILLMVYATTGSEAPSAALGCAISVDGRPVRQRAPATLAASCDTSFPR